MNATELNPGTVLQALTEFEHVLSLRELMVKEAAILCSLDSVSCAKNSALKYVHTVLKTHIRFIEEFGDDLDMKEEIARIRQVVTNLLKGRASLGAGVLEILETRNRRKFMQKFPDGYTRVGFGCGMDIQDEEEA